ncbi:MAG: HAD family hydrolase [bacterium]|nr:HAD family hydrolase [bacterium]
MRHVIWDWNGTLVNDLPVVVDAVNVSLAAIGEGPIDADGYRDFYTRPVRVFYERLLQRSVTDQEWAIIDRTFHKTYVESLHRVELTHDTIAAIQAVAAAGWTQSILSMWWHHDLVPEVVRHGLDGHMLRVDGNTKDAGETKARLLEIHLSNLGSNGASVMVGDATDDAIAALDVGVAAVLYDGGSHHRAELEAIGVPIADSLLHAVSIARSL